MPKRRLTLRVRIPPYRHGRNAWRRALHAAVVERQRIRRVSYSAFDRLEVRVLLYMERRSLRSNDVDNRVKDVLDALQGRAGGPKRLHRLSPVVPNDRQIFKLTVEKALPPKQSKGLGFLLVRKYTAGRHRD